MESREIWPPPPNIPLPVQREVKPQWFRPALLFGVAVNLVALSCSLGYMKMPAGESVIEDGINGEYFYFLIIAGFAFVVGVPLAIRQMLVHRKAGRNVFPEAIGLLLCLTPYWGGGFFLDIVVKAKKFEVI